MRFTLGSGALDDHDSVPENSSGLNVRSQLNRRIVMLEARMPVAGRRRKPLPDWLVAEFVAQGARLKHDGTLDLASLQERSRQVE